MQERIVIVARQKKWKPITVEPVRRAPSTEDQRASETNIDRHGFLEGSDLSRTAAILIEGGHGKADVIGRVQAEFEGQVTRNGAPKNAHSIVGATLSKLLERGYTVQQTWRVVPPKKGRKKAA